MFALHPDIALSSSRSQVGRGSRSHDFIAEYHAHQPRVDQAYGYPPPYYYPAYPDSQNTQTYPGFPNTHGPPGGYPQPQVATVVSAQPQTVVGQTVDNTMSLAIFATLCCCCPIGVCAILEASKAKKALEENDIGKAKMLAQKSKCMSTASIIFSIFIFVFGILPPAIWHLTQY